MHIAINVLSIGIHQVTAASAPVVYAEENLKEIQQICNGMCMILITIGMGRGTNIVNRPVVTEFTRDEG